MLMFQCKDACVVCTYCGGFQRLLCPVCHGSKRSVHRNEFTVEFVALKCAKCDVFGMIRCPHCWRGIAREKIPYTSLLKFHFSLNLWPPTNVHLYLRHYEGILCYALSNDVNTYNTYIYNTQAHTYTRTLTNRVAVLSHVVKYRS